MAKYRQGFYVPAHPEKYVGKGSIRYRSGWEKTAMAFFDNHPGIKQWASESIYIPYTCPLTGKTKNYIPDFFIIYETKDKVKKAEIIEIKPLKETGAKQVNSSRNKLIVARNTAKWTAAVAYCEKNNIGFRVVTEVELFGAGKGKR